MKIFLTGATGYIGSAIAEKLQASGYSLLGLARSNATAEKLAKRNIQPCLGDIKNPEQLVNIARQVDGVIHTAFIHDFDNWTNAVNIDCQVINAFTKALAGTQKPLIATSDTSVLGDTGTEIVDEDYPIATGFYLAERAKAEDAVLRASQHDIRSVVLRLPIYIYGRDRHKGGFMQMRLREAQGIGIAHYIAPGDHQVSAVHVDDVAQLYVKALEKAHAGSVYHAATESGLSEKKMAQTLRSITGCRIDAISLEDATLRWGHGIAAFLSINNQISADKAMRQIGWRPKMNRSLLNDMCQDSKL